MKHPKSASAWKKATHTFYLVQPVLQFLILAFAITALSRCSPLSPSGDKSPIKSLTGSTRLDSEQINALLSADWVEQSLKDIDETELLPVSDRQLEDLIKSVDDARASAAKYVETDPSAFAQVARAPSLTVKFNKNEIEALFLKGKVRRDISGQLAQLERLREQSLLLNTSALLVLSDERVKASDVPVLRLQVSLAVADAQHAVLQIAHRLAPEDPALKALAAIDAKHLSIVID